MPADTSILLVLSPDGTSRAYAHSGILDIFPQIEPAAIGDDRGKYRVYEVAGFSIDVMEQGGK